MNAVEWKDFQHTLEEGFKKVKWHGILQKQSAANHHLKQEHALEQSW